MLTIRKETDKSFRSLNSNLATPVVYCQANTKRGVRCHNTVAAGSNYCHLHAAAHDGDAVGKGQVLPDVATAANSSTSGRATHTRGSRTDDNPLLQTLANLLNKPSQVDDRPSAASKKTRSRATADATNRSNGASRNSAQDPFEALAAVVSAAAAAADQVPPENESKRGKRRSTSDDPLGKAVYAAAYGVGYGVALPTFLLLGMLPDNALGRGLRDGAKAAQITVERKRKR